MPRDLFLAGPHTYVPHRPRRHHDFGYGYVWPGYVYPGLPYAIGYEEADVAVRVATGILRLDVLPRSAGVYVDGYYMGLVDEYVRGRSMEARAYRLELRAPGFETVTVDLRLPAGETITYRADLVRNATAAPPPAPAPPPRPAAGQQTFYVIAGCYAGNLPPSSTRLPAGCDSKKLRVLR
jgi:hypothetical protein